MKISVVIERLQVVQKECGNIEVVLQNNPQDKSDVIVGDHIFFIVLEDYEECGFICNIRNWPY